MVQLFIVSVLILVAVFLMTHFLNKMGPKVIMRCFLAFGVFVFVILNNKRQTFLCNSCFKIPQNPTLLFLRVMLIALDLGVYLKNFYNLREKNSII